MALRARLTPLPKPVPEIWPWHSVKSKGVSVSILGRGDRRMEAETYLSSGFSIRQSIERQRDGWFPIGDIADVWMPGRLKGIQVAKGAGTPFFSATQVFDIRPTPRKWLAVERTPDAANRFVDSGQVLVTCSGAVGRATLAFEAHKNVLISHDLLRIDAKESKWKGWIYAFLHTPQARAMTTASHYGHIIKHLEPSHLMAIPIPAIDDATATTFNKSVARIVALRDKAYTLTLEAEAKFTEAIGSLDVKDWGEKCSVENPICLPICDA
ncbi:MAG: hypothetical protein AAGI37_20635 [Planctomycetota bacterium]